MAKREIKGTVKVDVYRLVNSCVERGIEGGWNRAHKHTDTPDEFIIKEEIEKYVMLELSEAFKFE